MKRTIEIKLSKKKLIKSVLVLSIFLVVCLLFVFIPDTFTSIICRNKYLIFVIGLLGIFLSIIYLYPIVLMYFKINVGLIISEKGIINKTEYFDLGLIKWSDINSVKTKVFGKGKYLLLDLKNEEEYLKKNDSYFIKFYTKFNKIQYGCIVHITHSTLDCTFEQLERLIVERFELSQDDYTSIAKSSAPSN